MLPGRCVRCLKERDVEEADRGIHGCDLSRLVPFRNKLAWPDLFGHRAAYHRGGDAYPDSSDTEDCFKVAVGAQATVAANCIEPFGNKRQVPTCPIIFLGLDQRAYTLYTK